MLNKHTSHDRSFRSKTQTLHSRRCPLLKLILPSRWAKLSSFRTSTMIDIDTASLGAMITPQSCESFSQTLMRRPEQMSTGWAFKRTLKCRRTPEAGRFKVERPLTQRGFACCHRSMAPSFHEKLFTYPREPISVQFGKFVKNAEWRVWYIFGLLEGMWAAKSYVMLDVDRNIN